MRGIVLGGIKYLDNRTIVCLYTDLKGKRSYIVNRRKRNDYIFPLSLIEFESSGRQNAELQYIKEFVRMPLLPDIPSSVPKSSIAMFIAEFLYKILKEDDPSTELFEYINVSVSTLDMLRHGVSNFHLYFMVELSRYIGFSIQDNENNCDYFDIKQNRFVFIKPLHPHFFDENDTKILSRLQEMTINQLEDLKLTAEQRLNFALRMLDFYSFRFDHRITVKSLKILHEIFR
jgi:DNA repair protein RecO (recombination protein O)